MGQFLHSSILSLKYVRFADFIKRCNLFPKRQKVIKFSAVLCFLKLYNDLDYITMKVKIMTIIFNISPYFVLVFFPYQIIAMKKLTYINGHCYVSV